MTLAYIAQREPCQHARLTHPSQMALVQLLRGAAHGEPLPVGLERLLQMPYVVVHHRQKEGSASAAGVQRALLGERRQVKLQRNETLARISTDCRASISFEKKRNMMCHQTCCAHAAEIVCSLLVGVGTSNCGETVT